MKRKDLLDALNKLIPAVSANPIVDEQACFRFTADTMRTSDGLLMVQIKTPDDMDIDCLVPASKFHKLISNMTVDEVVLTLTDGPALKVKSDKTTAKYKVFTEGGMLDTLPFDINSWADIPEKLLLGMSLCKFAVSKDPSRSALCGVLLTKGHIIASNGVRIARMPLDCEIAPLVLPINLINLAVSHNITQWAVDGDIVYFRTDDDTIVAGKVILGDYPPAADWLQQIEELNETIEIPIGVDDCLKRHLDQQTDVQQLDKEVLVKIDGNELTIHSEDIEKSYTLDEVVELAESVESPIAFTVHPEFLKDILSKTRTMSYSNDESLKFVAFSTDDGFQYMTCVERVEN